MIHMRKEEWMDWLDSNWTRRREAIYTRQDEISASSAWIITLTFAPVTSDLMSVR